jgi:hypothetical protein
MFQYVRLSGVGRPHAFRWLPEGRKHPPYTEINAWCETNIGPETDQRWRRGANAAYFVKDDDHAFAFRMRWC